MHNQGVPGSPLRDAPNKQNVVFQYKAPKELGGSIVVIILHGDDPLWTNDTFLKALEDEDRSVKLGMPDVMIALNAGIGAYLSWGDVIENAHVAGIPFAVTDYLEITVDSCVRDMVSRDTYASSARFLIYRVLVPESSESSSDTHT